MSSDGNTASKSLDDLVMDGKNCKTVMCLHCPSKILAPKNGEYRKVEFNLPELRRKRTVEGEADSPKEELLTDFWLVEDMYRFENMGFSNSVGNVKYLACADCEMGPLGLYEMDSKRSFVAIARFNLPELRRKRTVEGEADSPKEELLTDFWLVEDMYRFENMGFSNSVGNVKYLACADCEMGPLGLYEMDSKRSFVAIARVRHAA